MEITDLIHKYEKDYQIEASEEEMVSFNVNDKEHVIGLINEVIPIILGKSLEELDRSAQLPCGWIVEGILEESFGSNLTGMDYRDFVKEHVLRSYQRAKRTMELYSEGLKSLKK